MEAEYPTSTELFPSSSERASSQGIYLSPGREEGLLNNSFHINCSSCLLRLPGKGINQLRGDESGAENLC